MKKMIMSLIVAGSLLFGGCSVTKLPDPTDNGFPAAVEQVKKDVRTTTTLTVAGILVTLKEKDRVNTAQEANIVAKSIKDLVESDEYSLLDIKQLAINLVRNSNSADADTVALLLNSVVTLIENDLNVKFDNLNGDIRIKTGKQLILVACETIIEVTSPFVN